MTSLKMKHFQQEDRVEIEMECQMEGDVKSFDLRWLVGGEDRHAHHKVMLTFVLELTCIPPFWIPIFPRFAPD